MSTINELSNLSPQSNSSFDEFLAAFSFDEEEVENPPTEVNAVVVDSLTCEICGFVAKVERGLKTHKTRKHQSANVQDLATVQVSAAVQEPASVPELITVTEPAEN